MEIKRCNVECREREGVRERERRESRNKYERSPFGKKGRQRRIGPMDVCA